MWQPLRRFISPRPGSCRDGLVCEPERHTQGTCGTSGNSRGPKRPGLGDTAQVTSSAARDQPARGPWGLCWATPAAPAEPGCLPCGSRRRGRPSGPGQSSPKPMSSAHQPCLLTSPEGPPDVPEPNSACHEQKGKEHFHVSFTVTKRRLGRKWIR